MIFGEFPVEASEGLILAHSVRLADGRLGKGHRITEADVARLRTAGIASVIACRIEADDLGEDAAAAILAEAIDPGSLRLSPAATGRVNLYATCNGLFTADRETVDRFNRIDPAITFACLADHSDVRDGDLLATVKIIPLAAPRASVEAAAAVFREAVPIRLKPYRAHAVSLVATELPSLKPSVMDKTARVLEQRLAASGSRLVGERRVAHRAEAVAAAIEQALAEPQDAPQMVVLFGASAVADPADVLPEAIRMAGGTVEQVGLPVDPGNLLVLGHIGEVPVIGAPGCARSPKENGFDWVLNRLLAGERPTAHDLTGMGVGGLLMEIPSRPMPRETAEEPTRPVTVGAILLAAGRSSRMGRGGRHKLLAEFGGVPLVRLVAEHALDAIEGPVVAVTGYRAGEISACLGGLPLTIRENPDFATGMASSIRTGLSAEGMGGLDGVMILLADMPGVTVGDLEKLVEAFREAGGRAIVRAVAGGKRGNPVILPHSTFEAVQALEGDVGARSIVEGSGLAVIDVELGEAAHLDVDTPEAVLSAGGLLKG